MVMFLGKLRKILMPLKLRLIKCFFGFHNWKVQRSWLLPTSKFTTDRGTVRELHHAIVEPTSYEIECRFCHAEDTLYVGDVWTGLKPKKNYDLVEVEEQYKGMYRSIKKLQD
jgi:hypothetical protein